MFETGSYEYASVRRWAKRNIPSQNVFLAHTLFIPVNISSSHWCLVVAFMTEKVSTCVHRRTSYKNLTSHKNMFPQRIQFFDSMSNPHHEGAKFTDGLMRYFVDEVAVTCSFFLCFSVLDSSHGPC